MYENLINRMNSFFLKYYQSKCMILIIRIIRVLFVNCKAIFGKTIFTK